MAAHKVAITENAASRAYFEERDWQKERDVESYPPRSINSHGKGSATHFGSGPETERRHTVAPNPYGPPGKHQLGDDE